MEGPPGDAVQWVRVRDIRDRVLSLPERSRASYLDRACAADADLRREVESLLAAADRSAFIDRPALADDAETVTMPAVAALGAPILPGQRISHYQIASKIGEGGMGAVYKAVDTNLGRLVALKVISRPFVSADDKRRFAREAKAASALNHANIVTIYEYSSDNGIDFIAMELVEGMALDKLLKQGGTPLSTLVDYARQVAGALAKAHAAGIAHRDLKPANIMIAGDGVAKVLDFGLAKHSRDPEGAEGTATMALTQVGAVLGTPAYMSPEQAVGDPADFRSDIFSFGIILYEMVCGRRPFQGSDAQTTLRQIIYKDPPAVSEVNPSVPQQLSSLIEKCLHKDKEQRLHAISDATAVLERIAANSAVTAPIKDDPAPALTATPKVVPRRKRWIWTGLAATAALGIAGALLIPTVRHRLLPATTATLPQSSQDRYVVGQQYLERYDRKGNLEKAVESFQKAIDADPENAAAFAALAEAYLDRAAGSPDQQWAKLALESANKAIQLNPYLAVAHAHAGGALLGLGRADEAVRSIEHALQLDPKNAAAHAYRASAFEKRGDSQQAEAFYRKAVSLAPSVWWFQSSLGVFLARSGRYPEAIDVFEAAIRLSKDNGTLYTNLGGVYHLGGRDEDAAAAFQRSLEANPTARGFTNLGTLLYYLGRYREASQAFERAVALDGNPFTRWGNLADAYRWTPGSRDKAADAYTRAIQLVRQDLSRSPTDANLRSSLATYLAKSGHQGEALAAVTAIGGEALKNPAVLFKIR